jgi:hypothetical protein
MRNWHRQTGRSRCRTAHHLSVAVFFFVGGQRRRGSNLLLEENPGHATVSDEISVAGRGPELRHMPQVRVRSALNAAINLQLFMKAKTIAVLALLVTLALAWERPLSAAIRPAAFASPPISMCVSQRSTTTVPGSGEELRLTVDDITRGQVTVSLAGKDGALVLAPVSLQNHGTARFKFRNSEYVLRLTKLANALIGEDYVTFFISDPNSDVVPEDTKIEQLLEHIEKLDGAVFIRNGETHTSVEAALHLRNKWLLNRVDSARKFIDDHASKSTESGDSYQIRLPDGRTVPMGDYLRERLNELERRK